MKTASCSILRCEVVVVCPFCGSAGRLLIERPAPKVGAVASAGDTAPEAEQHQTDPVIAPMHQELKRAAALATGHQRRWVDAAKHPRIQDWCRLDAGTVAIWQGLGPTHGSGLRVMSVAREIGLTGPVEHRSTGDERSRSTAGGTDRLYGGSAATAEPSPLRTQLPCLWPSNRTLQGWI